MHNYKTRNNDKLRTSFAKHAYRDFRLVGVQVWNYVCDNIEIATSFSLFKKILKNVFYQKKNVLFDMILISY